MRAHLASRAVSCAALGVLSLALLAGCSRSASEDSVASLERDPARLRRVLEQCKQAGEALAEHQCRVAAEAWRRRFFADSRAQRSKDASGHEGSRP